MDIRTLPFMTDSVEARPVESNQQRGVQLHNKTYLILGCRILKAGVSIPVFLTGKETKDVYLTSGETYTLEVFKEPLLSDELLAERFKMLLQSMHFDFPMEMEAFRVT